jgi:hypothetical protein
VTVGEVVRVVLLFYLMPAWNGWWSLHATCLRSNVRRRTVRKARFGEWKNNGVTSNHKQILSEAA